MKRAPNHKSSVPRCGFTLVELAIVVLVIGILAAVAAPKMTNTAATARENGTKQSLRAVRGAIEFYRAQNGNFPTAATIDTSLQSYLTGPFPVAQIGANQNAAIAPSTQDPITSVESAPCGWVYNQATGELRVNDSSALSW